jgi:hypothetical protein
VAPVGLLTPPSGPGVGTERHQLSPA